MTVREKNFIVVVARNMFITISKDIMTAALGIIDALAANAAVLATNVINDIRLV
ncbi:hypothetical protein HNR44_001170 [Geomicrobium halophilum]|uniref:Uncharacterized protein n=1 Tax=Geomicrobium halophilum TaxID=549000 RepID=A0A841PSE8_9BACL|nr:hypothetical protein [Geomicrobium halophilum]MBB6449221.1 hypothetical protein [Geomicrobium halophilum]